MGGDEAVVLSEPQMPHHKHGIRAFFDMGDSRDPTEMVWAASPEPVYAPEPNVGMSEEALHTAGGDEPHDNMPPFLCVNFIIALQGVYPSRS
jgi:microcystin-dependent protein